MGIYLFSGRRLMPSGVLPFTNFCYDLLIEAWRC
jgi:hypothetical protein